MPALEYLIRPVVSPDYQPTPQPPPEPTDPDKQARLTDWDGGKIKVVKMTATVNWSMSNSQERQEIRRFATTIRVFNPDDHDQHVDVQLPQSVKMTSPPVPVTPSGGISGSGFTLDDLGQLVGNIQPVTRPDPLPRETGPEQDYKYAPMPADNIDFEVIDPGQWQDNPDYRPPA